MQCGMLYKHRLWAVWWLRECVRFHIDACTVHLYNIPYCIHSCLPEDEPKRFETYRRQQKTNIIITIIIIIIIFLHGLSRLTCSGIDALPSFPGASTISSSSRFVVKGVFRKSGVVQSFEVVDLVLFVFGYHVLYSRDL